MQLNPMLYVASTWVLPVLIAVTLHEAAHGFVAHLLGDDTAYRLGRVTFNPLRHIDPFGTILMPAIFCFFARHFFSDTPSPSPSTFEPYITRVAIWSLLPPPGRA
jgi:Zn-dependent protease